MVTMARRLSIKLMARVHFTDGGDWLQFYCYWCTQEWRRCLCFAEDTVQSKKETLSKTYVVNVTTGENTTNNTTCCGVQDVVKIT